MILPGSAVGGLGGTFLTFAGWTFFMTIWAITHIHETAHLSLEDADKAFSVSSIAQYKQYIISNTSYFFYFGEMSMFAYTSSMHCKPSLIGQSDEIDEMAASITSNPLVQVPLASSLKHDV